MKFLWLFLLLGLSLNLHAANPDPCKNVADNQARGTCRAFYAGCVNGGNASPVACARHRQQWTARTGLTLFPWETTPPVSCPCSGDVTFSAVLSGQNPITACSIVGDQIAVAGSCPYGSFQGGVFLDGTTWYCGAGCMAEVAISPKDYLQITAQEAAQCFLDVEAAADAQNVTCGIGSTE